MVGFFRSQRRFREKNIQLASKKKGDSWLQGGLMMFDRAGEFQFAYNTEFQEFDMDLITKAMKETRRQYRTHKQISSTASTSSASMTAVSIEESSSSMGDEVYVQFDKKRTERAQ